MYYTTINLKAHDEDYGYREQFTLFTFQLNNCVRIMNAFLDNSHSSCPRFDYITVNDTFADESQYDDLINIWITRVESSYKEYFINYDKSLKFPMEFKKHGEKVEILKSTCSNSLTLKLIIDFKNFKINLTARERYKSSCDELKLFNYQSTNVNIREILEINIEVAEDELISSLKVGKLNRYGDIEDLHYVDSANLVGLTIFN